MNLKNYKKYLPSKGFAIISGICGLVALAIFAIFFMPSSGENFSINGAKNLTPLKTANPTVTELIQRDSDGDGVPDWEEALWGTDPNKKMTFDGIPDATYIENKKKQLNIEDKAGIEEQNMTETERFAREFFASYTAMKSSGQVSNDAINNFSNVLGQKISNPNLIDRYKETDAKISGSDDLSSKQKYYMEVKNLFKTYQSQGLGDELGIISGQLKANQSGDAVNSSQNTRLSTIASAYEDFASKVIEVSVPQSLLDYHLRIANSANNTGISVFNMTKIISDPVVGLSGLSQYQKYSESLIKAVGDLETALK